MPIELHDELPLDIENYDLCVVFPPTYTGDILSESSQTVVEKLFRVLGEKHLYLFSLGEDGDTYLLLRAGLKVLKDRATTGGLQLLLDGELARQVAISGNKDYNVDPFTIPDCLEACRIVPFEYTYASFKSDIELQSLYWKPDDSAHPFRKNVRIRMIIEYLNDIDSENSGIDSNLLFLSDALLKGDIGAYFPIHEENTISAFIYSWAGSGYISMLFPPIDPIKDYFGEKIAFYFLNLVHIVKWTLVVAFLGLGAEGAQLYFDDFSRTELAAFACFISFWVIISFQFWLYEEKFTCLKWNMLQSGSRSLFQWYSTYCSATPRSIERNRPQFRGDVITSFVSGKDILFFRDDRRIWLFLLSFLVSFLWLLVSTTALAVIYWVHYNLINTRIDKYSQWVTSGLTALQIFIFNFLYRKIATYMTDNENHQFEDSYYNSLVIKIFGFQFMTTTMSFYYLAFFANIYADYLFRHESWGNMGYPDSVFHHCGFYSCMESLSINLVVITGLPLIVSLLWDFDYFHYVFVVFPLAVFSFMTTPVYSQPRPISYRKRSSSTGSDRYPNRQRYDNDTTTQGERLYEQPAMGDRQPSLLRQKSGSKSLAYDVEESKAATLHGETHYGDSSGSVGITAAALATLKERSALDRMHHHHDAADSYGDEARGGRGISGSLDLSSPPSSSDVRYDDVYNNNHDKMHLSRGARQSSMNKINMHNSVEGYESELRDAAFLEIGGSGSHENGFGNSNGNINNLNSDNNNAPANDVAASLHRHISMAQLTHTRCFTRCGELLTCQSKLFSLLALAFCFGAAFPGVFTIVIMYCWCEMKGRAWLLLTTYRRPVIYTPNSAGMEAIWKDMFEIVTYIVVFTNSALVIYTMDTFESWSMAHRLELFIAYVLVICVFRFVLSARLQKKADAEIAVHVARTELINAKLIIREADRENDVNLQML